MGKKVSSVGKKVSSVGKKVSSVGKKVSSTGKKVSSVGKKVSSDVANPATMKSLTRFTMTSLTTLLLRLEPLYYDVTNPSMTSLTSIP